MVVQLGDCVRLKELRRERLPEAPREEALPPLRILARVLKTAEKEGTMLRRRAHEMPAEVGAETVENPVAMIAASRAVYLPSL